MKIGIIGTGVFSVSVALLLATEKENKIELWTENESLVQEFHKTKRLDAIFKGKEIPKNISVTHSYLDVVKDKELLFLATGVSYIESVCKDIAPLVDKKIPICIGSKGIALDSQKFVHEIALKYLKNPIAVFGGPTFASDVANLAPVGFLIASKKNKALQVIEKAFQNIEAQITTSHDLTGLALCGCVKNIYAIGSGIIAGLGYQESTRALYLTSVFQELENLLYRFHAEYATLNSLAGFGDLVLTCSSTKSRNYTYGEMLGKEEKENAKVYLKENTVEGVKTLEGILPILKKKKINAPILYTIARIVLDNDNPKKFMEVLLQNKKKH